MTNSGGEAVDWAAVDRARRRDTLGALLVIAAVLAAITGLDDGYAGLHGTAGWVLTAGVYVVFVIAFLGVQALPGSRQRAAGARRVQYALAHHVDPGGPWRGRADAGARQLARLGWAVWGSPVGLVAVLAGGRWDRPVVAVPCALVLVGSATAAVVSFRRHQLAARRWLADPPGPRRDLPEPSSLERWTSGRRLLLVWLGATVLTTAVALSIALLS